MVRVILENVSKHFGTVQAVKDFNLTVLDKMHLFQKDPPNLRIKTES
jgi:ABC-type sugar transport system ATPase subunit